MKEEDQILPSEILFQIFSQVPGTSLLDLSRACRFFYAVSNLAGYPQRFFSPKLSSNQSKVKEYQIDKTCQCLHAVANWVFAFTDTHVLIFYKEPAVRHLQLVTRISYDSKIEYKIHGISCLWQDRNKMGLIDRLDLVCSTKNALGCEVYYQGIMWEYNDVWKFKSYCLEVPETISVVLFLAKYLLVIGRQTGEIDLQHNGKQRRTITTLRGHKDQIIAFSATLTQLASLSRDGTIRIWDLNTFDCEIALTCSNPNSIQTLQLDSDKLLAFGKQTGDCKGQLLLWDLKIQKLLMSTDVNEQWQACTLVEDYLIVSVSGEKPKLQCIPLSCFQELATIREAIDKELSVPRIKF